MVVHIENRQRGLVAGNARGSQSLRVALCQAKLQVGVDAWSERRVESRIQLCNALLDTGIRNVLGATVVDDVNHHGQGTQGMHVPLRLSALPGGLVSGLVVSLLGFVKFGMLLRHLIGRTAGKRDFFGCLGR